VRTWTFLLSTTDAGCSLGIPMLSTPFSTSSSTAGFGKRDARHRCQKLHPLPAPLLPNGGVHFRPRVEDTRGEPQCCALVDWVLYLFRGITPAGYPETRVGKLPPGMVRPTNSRASPNPV